MYSYRHAFHAGNHADVLKHSMLVGILKHLLQKDTPLTVVDTHAGAGLYRLDSDPSGTSGEAAEGLIKLGQASAALKNIAPLTADYLAMVAEFNKPGDWKVYPGSPFVIHRFLREEARDKLKLFEMHPTDAKALAGNIAQLKAGRQVTMARADGFESLKALLPPPNRRALVLVDPSYEIKSDYAKVVAAIQDALTRFATGVYAVWYPIIPRPEAHDLPRRLKTVTNSAGKPWLHAVLNIGHPPHVAGEEAAHGPGLSASGMFVVNPPHTLKPLLKEALPQLVDILGRGRGKSHVLEGS